MKIQGDRVKYIGPSVQVEADNRIILGKIPTSDGPTNAYTIIHGSNISLNEGTLAMLVAKALSCWSGLNSSGYFLLLSLNVSSLLKLFSIQSEKALSTGQRGEVYEVNGDSVAVIMDICENKEKKGEKDDKLGEKDMKPSVYWLPVKVIEHDPDAQAEDFYIAMVALCEVLLSMQPLIVYFPDCSQWLSRAVPKSDRKEFVYKVQEMFDQLSGPVVLICGQNKVETGSKEKEKFTMILPNFGRLAKLPLPLKQLTEGLKATKRSQHNDIYRLFNNVLCIHPPKEEELLRTFNRQVEEDRRIVISRSNISELHKVLQDHNLSCLELLNVNTDGVILTKQKAEKVVGWARNHYLSSCLLPSIKGERLNVPRESNCKAEGAGTNIQKALTKFKGMYFNFNLAKDEYENNFVSAVVPPGEIGVKFDDIGALEDVKKALNELVILPMRRPELFSHGNLLRPCKGILLFGPPGTGKTLLAKALATEAGANFISITGSTLTSKWFGDAEKLTKALFSYASKLSPVIIFVDEVDSLLGARGGAFEHEATRRMRNEFMAAWDGLRSKESQRILILGATNRPFDLDDAVIRRLPRRIYVDLPDAENRMKILKIFLAQEKLSTDFEFDKLANVTEGYSGSDLKNLCIAAAYRPVQELLDEERKGGSYGTFLELRPLNLDDFIQSKAKVGPSVAYDAASMNELRKWNEQYGEGGSRRRSPFGFGN
ncbi:ATPase, AAA-type, core [Dillenia turbinata]|uniref:ATPase, AAA-type, core n=1 Tax=Dillenia turbinata TaxID=194707 RepID=A0AAN8V0V1_9MAGN